MKEIILTIASCNECPYMETDLNSGDDYCAEGHIGYITIHDTAVILENCPLIDEEVLKDAEG